VRSLTRGGGWHTRDGFSDLAQRRGPEERHDMRLEGDAEGCLHGEVECGACVASWSRRTQARAQRLGAVALVLGAVTVGAQLW
jgi:hypothetical protein